MLAADTPENGWISIIYVLIWVNGCIHSSAIPKSEFRNSSSHYKENRKYLRKEGKSQNPPKLERIDYFSWKGSTASSSPHPDQIRTHQQLKHTIKGIAQVSLKH